MLVRKWVTSDQFKVGMVVLDYAGCEDKYPEPRKLLHQETGGAWVHSRGSRFGGGADWYEVEVDEVPPELGEVCL